MTKNIRYFALLAGVIFSFEYSHCQDDCKAIADCNGQVTWKEWPTACRESNEIPRQSEETPKEPRLHFLANTLTWTSGKVFCSSFYQRLCRSNELCVEGTHGRRFLFDVVPGDHWVPVSDAANEWVEIGDSVRRTCYKHGPHYGPPAWGISATSRPHKGYVYCCPRDEEEEEESGMRYQYIGCTATYASSQRHCEKQNLRLCSSVEVCVRNTPIYGVIRGDVWVAVNDRENEWVEVGDSNSRTCWIHGLHYGQPPWGTRTDGTEVPHVGYVYCCEKG